MHWSRLFSSKNLFLPFVKHKEISIVNWRGAKCFVSMPLISFSHDLTYCVRLHWTHSSSAQVFDVFLFIFFVVTIRFCQRHETSNVQTNWQRSINLYRRSCEIHFRLLNNVWQSSHYTEFSFNRFKCVNQRNRILNIQNAENSSTDHLTGTIDTETIIPITASIPFNYATKSQLRRWWVKFKKKNENEIHPMRRSSSNDFHLIIFQKINQNSESVTKFSMDDRYTWTHRRHRHL